MRQNAILIFLIGPCDCVKANKKKQNSKSGISEILARFIQKSLYLSETVLLHREKKMRIRSIHCIVYEPRGSFVNWSLCWNKESVARAMNFKTGYVARPEANLTEFIQIPIVLPFSSRRAAAISHRHGWSL